MKVFKSIFFVMTAMLMFSCADDSDMDDSGVVSSTINADFKELSLLLNIKTSDTSYLVVQSIDSVSIYVNDNYWNKISSVEVDTSKINKYSQNNCYNTKNKLSYLLVANQDLNSDQLLTAGDYAAYLNAFYELKPGEYLCFIQSFQVTLLDGTIQTYYPYVYKAFEVKENTYSAIIGELEINIY